MESADFSVEERYLIPSYVKLPISIERGEGLYVWDQTGKRYLDLYGGHAVSLVGHSHPRLVRAISKQASKLFFYSSVSYSSVRAKAAEDLVKFSGKDMQIFFSNSGAEANENALKIARNATGRSGILSFEGSFHGRTQGAMAVTGISKYRSEDSPHVQFAKYGDIESLKSLLNDKVGAVIFEAIQSLSGVRMASAEYYREAFNACREAGAQIIFDEIQTGLGRCGASMLYQRYEVEPDIITLAKGLAGGFPIGVTMANRNLVEKIKPGDLGSTFGGGPLASVLMSETLSIIADENLIQNAEARGRELKEMLKKISGVLEVRGEGLLIGIKTKRAASELVKEYLNRGILIGSSLDPEVIRLLPPLTATKDAIETFASTLKEIL